MNRTLCYSVVFLIFMHATVFLRAQDVNGQFPLIPYPAFIQSDVGAFQLSKTTLLDFDEAMEAKDVEGFRQQIRSFLGYSLGKTKIKAPAGNYIRFKIDRLRNEYDSVLKNAEGYTLICTQNNIEVKASTIKGLFYGLQSLIQLIQKSSTGILSIKACSIKDYPRFSYRGMHLDVSRHLFPVHSLKKWIDLLALYKINTFHWHLTDDQGWRIEIKKYPKLQSVSAYRKETIVGHKRADPHVFDGKSYGGYYTQEEVKEVVRYAMERHITVIPEIEMPGHAQAVLAAYPELGCTGGPYETATFWGVFEDVFCAGKEQTFTFLTGVIDEVLTIFPSSYIHIGGDECPKTRWKVCPKCQNRIKSEHLKDEHELQSYFIRRMEKYLESKERKIIGWDEILEGGLASSATVMSWQGLEGGIAAAKMKHDVIMSPEKYVYLDYYQSYQDDEQIAAGGFTPLSKIYGYEPVPEVLNEKDAVYIKGVQANLWSEYVNTTEKAEYMMFPRIIALAEIAWTQKDLKNYEGFLTRLRPQSEMLQRLKVNYFKNYDEIIGDSELINGKSTLLLQTTLPKGIIRYTTNGKVPGIESLVYKNPLVIDRTQQIKAAVFNNGAVVTPVFKKDFTISKSTGKKITLTYQPKGNYAPKGAASLINGISGSQLYNDGEWSGFSGENLEAVIDLEQQQQISQLGINILKHHWQRMWEPDLLKFEVSADGTNYTEVYKQSSFTKEGINEIRVTIKPVEIRYVKVTAINKGIIPKGGYGAGGKAWLLADEIFIN
ncbi:family 20 glycosylhydrolase [Pedobacter hiemivivus]|uniref:beta-N-acetylhexosaminidase n=1 Tax=Pedobacter hiemivivus TaxID=2530454 RepID=A0A4R0NHI5_9SPHI|nr:family 20 glycosylhydrolase [Pedobacter hiemivivus]TCC99217.1 beta-hexosaminidase [Pedobacter hiemivivus]